MPARVCQEIVLRLMVANSLWLKVRSQIALAGKCPLPGIKGTEQDTIPISGLSCNNLIGIPGLGGAWTDKGGITMYDFTSHNMHMHKQKEKERQNHIKAVILVVRLGCFSCFVCFSAYLKLCNEYVLLL